jgi:hypothetical protein
MGYQLNIKNRIIFCTSTDFKHESNKGNKGAKKHSIATAPNALYVTIFFAMKRNR